MAIHPTYGQVLQTWVPFPPPPLSDKPLPLLVGDKHWSTRGKVKRWLVTPLSWWGRFVP